MKLPAIIVAILIATISIAQDQPDCSTIKLKTQEEVNAAEPCVNQLCDLVLSKPLGESGEKGHEARKTILSWMDKSPKHAFSINNKMMKLCEGENVLLFGVYMTCLAKGAIENGKGFEKKSLELFVKYVRNVDNKVYETTAIRKLIQDWEKGKVEKYLN